MTENEVKVMVQVQHPAQPPSSYSLLLEGMHAHTLQCYQTPRKHLIKFILHNPLSPPF